MHLHQQPALAASRQSKGSVLMLEIVTAYFLSLIWYPLTTAAYALEQPWQIAVWFAVGVVLFVVLRRTSFPALSKIWFSLWFMPGTIICGAWTLYPWPFAVWAATQRGGCSSLLSLTICLCLNLLIVFGIASLWKLWRIRRKTA